MPPVLERALVPPVLVLPVLVLVLPVLVLPVLQVSELVPEPGLRVRQPGRFRGRRRASGARNRRKGLLQRVGE